MKSVAVVFGVALGDSGIMFHYCFPGPTVRIFACLVVAARIGSMALAVNADDAPPVAMKIVQAQSAGDASEFRQILVSPTVNTPEPFEGFGGFCGWPKVCRLQNGDLFVTFCAGYWHASWPTPLADSQGPEYAQSLAERRGKWLLEWNCPIGAKMMWIRSRDNGKSWTRPKPFPVIPGAYAIGAVTQHSDGTVYAAAVIQLGEGYRTRMPTNPTEYMRIASRLLMARKTVVFRSDDDGETWDEAGRFSGPFLFPEHPQTLFEAPDGSLLMLTNGVPYPAGTGWPSETAHYVTLLLKSADRGANWSPVSVIGMQDFDVEEGSAAYLPDGSIGFGARPTSAWFQSYDNGRTWSEPLQLHKGQGTPSKALYKKGDLVVTRDGIVVLVFSGGPGGNGQVMYSRDSGRTWIKPAMDRGFKFDPHAYYPNACVLDDGSIFVVGDHQGFQNKFGPYGAEVTGVRFRIRTAEEGEGVELLPIGGAAK